MLSKMFLSVMVVGAGCLLQSACGDRFREELSSRMDQMEQEMQLMAQQLQESEERNNQLPMILDLVPALSERVGNLGYQVEQMGKQMQSLVQQQEDFAYEMKKEYDLSRPLLQEHLKGTQNWTRRSDKRYNELSERVEALVCQGISKKTEKEKEEDLRQAVIDGDLYKFTALMTCINGNEIHQNSCFPPFLVDYTPRKSDSNLRIAVTLDRAEMVDILLKNGSTPENEYFGPLRTNMLMKASELQYEGVVATLLKHSVIDVNEQDLEGNTALLYNLFGLCKSSNLEIVKELLEHGADPNLSGTENTVMCEAVLQGNEILVRMLAEHGGEVNSKYGPLGATPLLVASNLGLEKITKVLLDMGALIDSTDNNGNTALMAAINGIKRRNELRLSTSSKENLEVLLANRADISIRNKAGKTAADIAREMGISTEVLTMLDQKTERLN